MLVHFFSSLALTLLVCSVGQTVGARLGLMDYPDGKRKLHRAATPMVGGVALMAGLLPFFLGFTVPTTQILFVAVLGLFVLGAIDDRRSLSPLLRFAAFFGIILTILALLPELLAVELTVAAAADVIRLTALLPNWAIALAMAVVFVGFVVSVNMADGVNGLATGLLFLWAGLFLVNAPAPMQQAGHLVFAALLVIWCFNVTGRLFMGDSGVYAAAGLLALLILVRLAEHPATLPVDTITVWVAVPMFDCLRLIVTRTRAGRSPLSGDRNHLHHKLLAVLPPQRAVAVYLFAAGVPAGLATVAPQFNAAWIGLAVGAYLAAVNAGGIALWLRRAGASVESGAAP